MAMSSIRALLDIGTNAVKLTVLRDAPERLETLIEAERVCRLGDGALDSGHLRGSAVRRTLKAVDDLLDEAKIFSLDRTIIFGTAILRMVDNAVTLTDAIHERFGIHVRLLSEAEEATAGFLAVRSELPEGPLLTLDVGGGTVELAHGSGLRPDWHTSLPLGGRALLGCVPVDDPPKPGQVDAVAKYIRENTTGLKPPPDGAGLVLIGGAAVTLAGYARTIMGAPGGRVANELYPETLDRMIKLLSGMTLRERRGIPGANPDRSDVILYGAVILREMMSILGAKVAKVSERGLTHGYLEAERAGVPLDPAEPVFALPSVDFPPIQRSDRASEVVFLLRHSGGGVWLQRKARYPNGVFRLPGGGINIGEPQLEAARREIAEETGYDPVLPTPLSLMRYAGPGNKPVPFTTFLVLEEAGEQVPYCTDEGEEVEEWKLVPPGKLEQWARRLEFLPEPFKAWGVFRATALRHAIALHERGSW